MKNSDSTPAVVAVLVSLELLCVTVVVAEHLCDMAALVARLASLFYFVETNLCLIFVLGSDMGVWSVLTCTCRVLCLLHVFLYL